MNNKSFIQGFLYGLAFAESVVKEHLNPGKQVLVWFSDGTFLRFAINRGISHIYGDHVAMCTQEEDCNLFDIAKCWLTQEQFEKIESLGHDFEYAGIRINLDELCQIIDTLGVIDYNITQQEWLKIYLKCYHKVE